MYFRVISNYENYIFFINFIFSTTLFAQKIIYHCDMNVVYRLNFDSDWTNKNKVMTFTISNKKIKIYDHSIKLTYSTELNVFSNKIKLLHIIMT